jgi:cytosine/adenosine deaminase-related metal-dependent hydrolase
MKRLLVSLSMLVSTAAHAQICDVTLTNANVWNGEVYQKQTLSIRAGQFVEPDEALPKVDGSPLFLLPPFADAHTHAIDTAKPGNAMHSKAIAQGIFYALNPNIFVQKAQRRLRQPGWLSCKQPVAA